MHIGAQQEDIRALHPSPSISASKKFPNISIVDSSQFLSLDTYSSTDPVPANRKIQQEMNGLLICEKAKLLRDH